MIRELTPADAAETLALLRARPLRNLFLDYVVSTGGLGRASGLLGYVATGRIGGVLMIGPLGVKSFTASTGARAIISR